MGSALSPITADENLHSGEDFVVNIDVIGEDGNPEDMLGWTLEWVLRKGPLEDDLVTKVTGVGISIENGVATRDRARVLVKSADTTGLDSGTYYHRLLRTDLGNVFVLAFGPVELKDSNVGE